MKPSTLHQCPVCEHEGEFEPQDRQFEHATIKGTKKGMWYYYFCDNCEVQFTTNESDTISMKRWEE